MSEITDYILDNSLTLNTGNLIEAVLVSGISAGDQTPTIRLRVESGVTMITPPFLALITASRGAEDQKLGEIVLFTAVSEGDPDEFSLMRFESQGYETKTHLQGELVLLNAFSEHFEVQNSRIVSANTLTGVIKKFLRNAFGTGDDLIIRTTFDPTTDGLATYVGNVVTVNPLIGFADGDPVDFAGWTINYVDNAESESSDDTSITLKRPSGAQKRIDLVEINNLGEVVVTKGTPDTTVYTAPARTSGRIPLAEISINSTTVFSVSDVREFF